MIHRVKMLMNFLVKTTIMKLKNRDPSCFLLLFRVKTYAVLPACKTFYEN